MTGEKNITTDTLLKRLFRTSSFERFKTRYGAEMHTPAFCDYLDALCKERGESHEAVIKRAEIDRVYGHQIFCGRRRPSRDKVIQLAFGFCMSAEAAQELLQAAGHRRLYPRIERDAALLFCLHNGNTVMETHAMLIENSLPMLGEETSI